MAVAKSYIGLTQTCEPYQNDNGKMYVKVILKSGKEKEVRWYNDSEFEKMYAGTSVVKTPSPDATAIKHALGFDNGYITIFRGDQETNNDWFRFSNARYARYWGWYVVSTEEIPENLPFGIEPIKLYWKDIIGPDGNMKPENKVKEIVDVLLYGESDSQFVGSIGERLELIVKVAKAIQFDGAYGKTTMHIMHDDSGNEYIWTTGAKTLTIDKEYSMRGSIKDHRVYKGVNQTILTRCLILDKPI